MRARMRHPRAVPQRRLAFGLHPPQELVACGPADPLPLIQLRHRPLAARVVRDEVPPLPLLVGLHPGHPLCKGCPRTPVKHEPGPEPDPGPQAAARWCQGSPQDCGILENPIRCEAERSEVQIFRFVYESGRLFPRSVLG